MTRLLRIKMAVAGVLGSVCARCHLTIYWPWDPQRPGNAPQRDCLQVGHPNGRKWSIRRVNQTTRWLRYLTEALRSPCWCKETHRFIPWVQAECGPCNRKHGGSIRYAGRKGKTRQGKRLDPKAFYRQIGQAVEAVAVKNSHEFWKNQG